MASAIFFGGRRLNIPGAYSDIDASALSSISPSAVGIVALIGTAEGGKPLTVTESESDVTRAEQIFGRYRSGDLRTASLFALEPSLDEAVPFGAQKLVNVKVNPAAQSTAVLVDDGGNDAIDMSSKDYGLFTSQINVSVEDGTTQGKKVSIVFEDNTEVFDDIGGETVFSLEYTPGSFGFTTAVAAAEASRFYVRGNRSSIAGKVTERTADIPAPGPVRVVSDDASDVTQSVIVYGLDGSDNGVRESLKLNGTTPVDGTVAFTKVLGMRKTASTAGTVTVTDQVGPTTLFTATDTQETRGLVAMTNMGTDGVVTLISGAAAQQAGVVGLSASGSEIIEGFNVGTSAVDGSLQFSEITYLAVGDSLAGTNFTVGADMVSASHAAFPTVQKFADRCNARPGLACTVAVTNPTTFAMADLDLTPPVTVLSVSTPFLANLAAVIEEINAKSAYVTASRASGAGAVPANTAAPVFLVGGEEGTPTISEWSQAFQLLESRRVNVVVPLTNDPAVHALLASHLRKRAGELRSEANGYIGIGTDAGAGETRANVQSQIQALATRHISAISQECQRTDPDTGASAWYAPHFFAAIAAGMQAGSPIGEPLTRKRPFVTDVRNDSSWAVVNDASDLIDRGLMMAEKVDGLGIRWIRSITTHLADDNVVFSEMSANESANQAVFEFRRAMEQRIGRRGLAGSSAVLKGLANDVLNRLIDDEVIVAYRALQVEQIGDVFPISVEIAPVLPINFIPITVHLVAVRTSA